MTWLALVSVVAAPPLGAQEGAASPPPPRSFGPDQTATGAFTGSGTTPPELSCDSPADASTAITCDGFLASGLDGALLETTVRVPRGAGPHPLVVAMHGWGQNRDAMATYDDRLTGEGYAVLRYSARGFGGSWGQANLADVDVEGEDLRSLIGQVVDDERVDAAPAAVAVFGPSYGGAQTWLAALVPAFDSPAGKHVVIRTVVPIATWSDLLYALVPNGRPQQAQDPAGAEKLSYVQALFAAGTRARADRPYRNLPDYLGRWNAAVSFNEVPYGATPLGTEVVNGLQGYRSVYWQEPFWTRVRANAAAGAAQLPIFAVQGFTDDLFPARELLRLYDALRAVDPAYPIALYLGDLGHPRAANKRGELAYVVDQAVAWLGWYLKGAGAQPAFDVQVAITRPPAAAFSAADVIRVSTYANLSTAIATARFDTVKVLTFDPASALGGFAWDPIVLSSCGQLLPCPPAPPSDVVPGDVAAFTVPVARFSPASPLLVAGEPVVSFWTVTVAHRVQFDVRMFDVAPDGARALITRGTLMVDTGSPARPIGFARIRVPTFGNVWEAPADHALGFEVTNVDSPYLRPTLVPSATLLGGVEVTIPIRR